MKEGAKAPQVSLEELNEVWYEVFGHYYTHCIQLSKLQGEIGALHRGHIEYIQKEISTPQQPKNTVK